MKYKFLAMFCVLGVVSAGANAGLLGYHHGDGGCGGGWHEDDPVCTETWSDSWDGSPVKLSSRGTSAWEYTFDITDDGFVVGEDTVYDYGLTFGFKDDSYFDYFEYVKIFQAGETTSYWEVDSGHKSFDGILEGVSELNDSGQLLVKLFVTQGDFFLTDAELLACGVDDIVPPSTSVPEPTTLALLGLGLIGIGLVRRRQASYEA